jgi:hypothetical protein
MVPVFRFGCVALAIADDPVLWQRLSCPVDRLSGDAGQEAQA